MIIDGKKIAEDLVVAMRAFVDARGIAPRMVAITAAPDTPTQQFLRIKARVAERIGTSMRVVELPQTCTDADVTEALASAMSEADGIVLQLPFPEHIFIEGLLAKLPSDLDPDCIGTASGGHVRSHDSTILPPVVSAIRHICRLHAVALEGKRVAVVGQGRLVGAPAATWFEEMGAEVARLTKSSENLKEAILHAEILVLGAGVPGLVTPDMLTEGVVIYDAGASEEGGRVVGDADPVCANTAHLFTPVPGGIGPIAVAELFGNMLRLQFGME